MLATIAAKLSCRFRVVTNTKSDTTISTMLEFGLNPAPKRESILMGRGG
jgi:hypothetical protein